MRFMIATDTGADTSMVVAASATPIGVELRADLELPAPDAAALDALIDAQPAVGVFLSRAWLSGFFAEPPAGVEPRLLVLRDGSALRGATAIGVQQGRTHVRVTLLGGHLGSDRVDLLAARGFETACADAVLDWLARSFGRRGFLLELRDVPAASPLWGAIHRAAGSGTGSIVLQPREVQVLPYLDLENKRAQAAGPSQRSVDKHRRWLERRGRIRLEILLDPYEVLWGFDSLVRFLEARWKDSAGGSALDSPRVQRFHRFVLPRLLQDGRLRMVRLSADMRTVAIFYGLAAGRWWGYYLAGYDREWAGRIHLGRLLLASAIDLAEQQRALEFDFLKGTEPVKYLWPVRERITLDADLYSTGPGPQFVRAGRATREAAAALLKCGSHFRVPQS
jgi:CelD/BcsL family acetyltransferase involved in cellulose biosynthesis